MVEKLDQSIIDQLNEAITKQNRKYNIESFINKLMDEININKNFEKVAQINRIDVDVLEKIYEKLNCTIDDIGI